MSAIPNSKAGPFPIKAILACVAYTNFSDAINREYAQPFFARGLVYTSEAEGRHAQ